MRSPPLLDSPCGLSDLLPLRVVDPAGDSHHGPAALSPSSDEESGEVSRGSYMREMPDPTKPQVKGQKNNL